ncbi:energy-coupling factor transport system substrate-specific component [Microlunatus sagamiharensis]|uniref:Energy-coupling factor transport system substrate-specific component n=1 Tax=Microlunatus sagamiharensis TaxID=546874 RepID=A0A1H2MGS8_9ACTN|nr:ECF transporter S component [Microlunatus sagamiharensis]SDU92457.1 energy-coupling factor transport system substrate-specific component [Microlunatus sagamiharensis]
MTSSTRTPDPTARARRPRDRRWRTVDLITVVLLAVAFGIAFVGWGALTNVVQPVFTALPPLAGLVYGFFWVPAVVAALVVRRPGAALLAELVAASVEPLLGGQWGIATLGSGALQGLGVELGFALLAYRRWTLLPAVLGGILAGIFEAPYEWRLYYPEWSAGYAGLYAVALAVSGALLAGLLGWVIVRALARTGALAPFAAGRERLAGRH